MSYSLVPPQKRKKNKNKNEKKRRKKRSRASIALSRIATRNLTEFTRSKTSDVKINQVNSTWYQFNMMLAGGNANVWFCSVRNRTGIVRGTRVIVRNGRNDAFEPGGLIKSASKPHGSIFSDRLDDINCHFLLDTCHPANFNCPRIRGSHANAHDRQTWIQSRFQILIDRGGKFNSRCKVLHRSKRKLRKTPVRSSARVGRHDHGFSRMSLLVRYILFPSIRFDFPMIYASFIDQAG